MRYVLFILISSISCLTAYSDVSISYHTLDSQQKFAVDILETTLNRMGHELQRRSIVSSKPSDIVVLSLMKDKELNPEGYKIFQSDQDNGRICVIHAKDNTGAMYGILDVNEQLRMGSGLNELETKVENPKFEFRAIKFNLPWSPYRPSEPTPQHITTCRDLEYWREFLDMMARNRFNVLSLWNLHPFTYMFRPENFPKATPFNDEELADWKHFWKSLFRMAKERGIETYIVNWNIVVSPEFAKAYGAKERNDTSGIVKRYTRECVTQLINEYPNLTGVGVTLADWMNDMTPKEREDWIEDTFVAGMNVADRKAKFIHRSVLAGDPMEMRRVIDNANLPDPVWVEVKFNWSHGHSTPRLAMTHDYSSGEIDERFWNPKPDNYKIAWMIRNEDFFILRWGEPGFIRKHIDANDHDYVGGYFVGSEGYIPAQNLSQIPGNEKSWNYAFEKQWLFYTLWGRLLYNPEIADAVFAEKFNQRYGHNVGDDLLQAYRLASRMPLRLASFHAATWDYTLYSEGFIAPAKSRGRHDGESPLINILELIEHQTLDPTFLSIQEFVQAKQASEEIENEMTTPLELADMCEEDGKDALELLDALKKKVTPFNETLQSEILDVETWAYLSLYFAEKLRAGVALETFRQTGDEDKKTLAIAHLEKAVEHWDDVIIVTEERYRPISHVYSEMYRWREKSKRHGEGIFHWKLYKEDVMHDIQLAQDVEAKN